MPNEQPKRPKVFVLMQFADHFNDVYNLFVVPTLSEAGFDVTRADDMKSSQNILKDIIKGIAECDLIVADLTDSNANVYYELGIAHTLGKPTVLLTQSIDDLPFDLRSYRVIPYSTHFAEVSRAKVEMKGLADGFLSGKATFSGPVTDFLPEAIGKKNQVQEQANEGEAGFLDHLASLEEGFEELERNILSLTEKTSVWTGKMRHATEQITSISSHPVRSSARRARMVVMELAQGMENYVKSLGEGNVQYSETLAKIRTSLETVIKMHNPNTEEARKSLAGFLSILSGMESGVRYGLENGNQLIDTLEQIPSTERTFSRARDHTVNELKTLSANFEQTLAMVVRVREIGERKLDHDPVISRDK